MKILYACWKKVWVYQVLRQIHTHVVQSVGWTLCWVTAGVSSRRKVAQLARPLITEIHAFMFQQSFMVKSVIYTGFSCNNDTCQLRHSKIFFAWHLIYFIFATLMYIHHQGTIIMKEMQKGCSFFIFTHKSLYSVSTVSKHETSTYKPTTSKSDHCRRLLAINF